MNRLQRATSLFWSREKNISPFLTNFQFNPTMKTKRQRRAEARAYKRERYFAIGRKAYAKEKALIYRTARAAVMPAKVAEPDHGYREG